MEVEAKFDLSEVATARTLSTAPELGPFRLGAPETLHLTDQYVDTTRRDCFQRGYECRLRISEHGALVTLKGVNQSDGAGTPGTFRREEIEQRLPAATFNPSHWPVGPARDLVEGLCQGHPLVPTLTLRQERLERPLFDDDREVGALTVDRVRPELAGREPHEFAVVEVELSWEGTETDLQRVSTALRALPGLKPATQSKYARVQALMWHREKEND